MKLLHTLLLISFSLLISSFLLSCEAAGVEAEDSRNQTDCVLNPIKIHEVQGLRSIDLTEKSRKCSYQLTADIDLSGYLWEPLGSDTEPFLGTFDGQGHTIRGLQVNKTKSNYAGLFNQIGNLSKHVEISNLKIVVHEDGIKGRVHVGALAGYSTATITNVQVSGGPVNGTEEVGGLVGKQYIGAITNSYSTAPVSGESNLGGLVGLINGGTINNSYSTASVSGENNLGGLVGLMNGGSTINNSYSTAPVSGESNLGGLVGLCIDASIINTYATGTVNGTGNNLGGLVGQFSIGEIINSYYVKPIAETLNGIGNVDPDEVGTVTGYYTANDGTVRKNNPSRTPIKKSDFEGLPGTDDDDWDFIGIATTTPVTYPVWTMNEGEWPLLYWQMQ